jgi:hypothetical protein
MGQNPTLSRAGCPPDATSSQFGHACNRLSLLVAKLYVFEGGPLCVVGLGIFRTLVLDVDLEAFLAEESLESWQVACVGEYLGGSPVIENVEALNILQEDLLTSVLLLLFPSH